VLFTPFFLEEGVRAQKFRGPQFKPGITPTPFKALGRVPRGVKTQYGDLGTAQFFDPIFNGGFPNVTQPGLGENSGRKLGENPAKGTNARV